tara:strand:+ start:660 stop:947 length:288 start_codon:yes stop_codon:yes gene_type:complete
MSEDKLDKNGIWQGTQGEYFEFSKEIIDECYDRDSFQVIDPMLEEILKQIPQDKLESIISKHADKMVKICEIDKEEECFHRLGLLIKSKLINNNE